MKVWAWIYDNWEAVIYGVMFFGAYTLTIISINRSDAMKEEKREADATAKRKKEEQGSLSQKAETAINKDGE